jgi:hypothetical protein
MALIARKNAGRKNGKRRIFFLQLSLDCGMISPEN